MYLAFQALDLNHIEVFQDTGLKSHELLCEKTPAEEKSIKQQDALGK